MKRLRWIAELLIIFMIAMPFLFLPVRSGRLLGGIIYYLWGKRREIARRNVELAIIPGGIKGEPDTIVRKNFEALGLSIVELIKLYFGIGKGIIDRIRFTGVENIRKAKEKGKGIIFITGHCGNWELLALATSLKITPIYVLARRINNPYLNYLIEKLRSRYGNRVIYKQGALKEIIKTLRNNGSVGILMDQAVLPVEGIVVDFLGRPAWTTKMPVLIAKKTGAPILPVFIRRIGMEQEIIIYPEVMLSLNNGDYLIDNTRKLNSLIGDYIRENPEEWLWIHRRWKRIGQDE